MKKILCFFMIVGTFLVCSNVVFAHSEFFIDGIIADNDLDESNDSEDSNDSNNSTDSDGSSGGNHFDASWETGDPIIPGTTECSSVFKNSDGSFNEFGEFIQDIFTLIKFAAPILVIAFSTIDYTKAISHQNADELKKANGRFVKRLIAGVAVFLLPFILDFIFDIFGLYGLDTCGIR